MKSYAIGKVVSIEKDGSQGIIQTKRKLVHVDMGDLPFKMEIGNRVKISLGTFRIRKGKPIVYLTYKDDEPEITIEKSVFP